MEDFSIACQLMPEYGDAWKRRGQARSALGENEGALEVCSGAKCPRVLQLHAVLLVGPLSCWCGWDAAVWRGGISGGIWGAQQAFPGMLCSFCPAGAL